MKFTTALSTLALLASAVQAQENGTTVVDIAIGSPDHTTLVDLVVQAGLADLLSGEGPWTVFAPTNEAFAALPEEAMKYTTPEWHMHLEDILKYHVAAAKAMSTDLVVDEPIGMANGEDTVITSLGPPPVINNSSNIDPADIEADNGVVHVIDAVLTPTSITSNIVEIASGADDFSILVDAVVAAGLAETLGSDGPFTVFAPTNEAFRAVDSDTLDYLLSPDGQEDLINVLTYHVFPGVVYQSDIAAANITMVNEDMATISVDPAMINDAMILAPEILASNGVIHPIDKVILPPAGDDTETPPVVDDSDMNGNETLPASDVEEDSHSEDHSHSHDGESSSDDKVAPESLESSAAVMGSVAAIVTASIAFFLA